MKSALVDDPLYASTAALRKQGALLDAWFDDPECAQIECVLTSPLRVLSTHSDNHS